MALSTKSCFTIGGNCIILTVKGYVLGENEIMNRKTVFKIICEYGLITFAVLLMDVGIYVFKFPNHFSFGGVSGLAVILNRLLGISASQINLVINLVLLVFGFIMLGKGFGIKTTYATILSSVVLSLMEWKLPLSGPLTHEPILELLYAIAFPAVAAAILFYVNASGGGTDIIAMVLKKYTTVDIGMALLLTDTVIVMLSFLVFDIPTGLFSVCGLIAKSIFVDQTLDQMKLSKYFTIICTEPAPICAFIKDVLHRSATIYHAEGIYTHEGKTIILCALDPRQAVILQRYIRRIEPSAFIMITKSSETIGKGFQLSI